MFAFLLASVPNVSFRQRKVEVLCLFTVQWTDCWRGDFRHNDGWWWYYPHPHTHVCVAYQNCKTNSVCTVFFFVSISFFCLISYNIYCFAILYVRLFHLWKGFLLQALMNIFYILMTLSLFWLFNFFPKFVHFDLLQICVVCTFQKNLIWEKRSNGYWKIIGLIEYLSAVSWY